MKNGTSFLIQLKRAFLIKLSRPPSSYAKGIRVRGIYCRERERGLTRIPLLRVPKTPDRPGEPRRARMRSRVRVALRRVGAFRRANVTRARLTLDVPRLMTVNAGTLQ